jgi:hypothetical protein
MRRTSALAATLGLLSALAGVLGPAPRVTATPVAPDEARYRLYGRVFPDPHGCLPRRAPFSPWAKGKVCAIDFIQFDEMVAGLRFLERLFPGFLDVFRLDERFGDPSYVSAGLGLGDPSPLWMVRVTDERVPDAGKKHYLFPLSIHGIERAGVEGGVRAIEDLVTWAGCERDPNASPACAAERPLPHPILETSPGASITAGEALRRAAIYFMFPNPDGWRRGDRGSGFFYMRYNGNGVDLNRDWPSLGFVFEPYTPLSEPESRAFAAVLPRIRPRWDGGIDLHGQLVDRAFSFTLLGQGPRDFGANQATLDVVEGAWRDAEARLSWSRLIKPNDAPADDPRLYGVQWGTVWDTIGYTTTGALGDWVGSPIGLGAEVAIDNEMSLSHVSNCGVGTCFIPEAEQLHVDGNKSLIYSLVNFGLRPEDRTFRVPGRVAYLDNPSFVSAGAAAAARLPDLGLPPQPDILARLDPTNGWTHEFDVLGPAQGRLNRGFKVDVRALGVAAVSPGALATAVVERRTRDGWEVVNSYFNQSPIYLQAGQTVDVNEPEPGRWRVRMESPEPGLVFEARIDFRDAPAWPNPGQRAYRVRSVEFFEDLNRYADRPLERVTADAILGGAVDLSAYDTLVIADQMLPGYVERPPTGPAQAPIRFAGSDASNPTYPCASPTTVDPPPPGCQATFEWTVDGTKNNQTMTVSLDWGSSVNDFDLYVDRFAPSGETWTPVGQSATGAKPETVTLVKPVPGRYRARVVNYASAEPLPKELTVTFSNEGPPAPPPGPRTEADLRAFAARLRSFVEGGGNLVLTDGALRLLAPMGVLERSDIHDFSAYAGYIGFTADGSTPTYDHPLARDVQRPGAAEGPGHRHQTYEPVPLGFAIQDPSGADASTAPIWAVDQTAWERRGGVTVGTTTADQVTLGELRLGRGVVRIIGALLPTPTDRFFHPWGLAAYAVTYSGYQVLQNALAHRVPERAVLGTRVERPAPRRALPATGLAAQATAAGGLLGAALALARWGRRAR